MKPCNVIRGCKARLLQGRQCAAAALALSASRRGFCEQAKEEEISSTQQTSDSTADVFSLARNEEDQGRASRSRGRSSRNTKSRGTRRATRTDGPPLLLERGPRHMCREDVLDFCASFNVFLAPEAVSARYRADAMDGLVIRGWCLDVPAEQRRRAIKMKGAKVVCPVSVIMACSVTTQLAAQMRKRATNGFQLHQVPCQEAWSRCVTYPASQ
jgi:hypothetical protein